MCEKKIIINAYSKDNTDLQLYGNKNICKLDNINISKWMYG